MNKPINRPDWIVTAANKIALLAKDHCDYIREGEINYANLSEETVVGVIAQEYWAGGAIMKATIDRQAAQIERLRELCNRSVIEIGAWVDETDERDWDTDSSIRLIDDLRAALAESEE